LSSSFSSLFAHGHQVDLGLFLEGVHVARDVQVEVVLGDLGWVVAR
jgi:hypothetical protein